MLALDNLSLSIEPGAIGLVGQNGAGKSTLIKILTGVYHRDSGSIFLEGSEISPTNVGEAQALGIGTVYQEVNLLENLTVAENLFLGRQPRRFGLIDRSAMQKNSQALLAQYGLSIDVNALLSSYSVAIRQIIAIARAVDLSGKVLVLGDHRGNSFDGRFFGFVDADKVYGRAVAVYYRRGDGFEWQRL